MVASKLTSVSLSERPRGPGPASSPIWKPGTRYVSGSLLNPANRPFRMTPIAGLKRLAAAVETGDSGGAARTGGEGTVGTAGGSAAVVGGNAGATGAVAGG